MDLGHCFQFSSVREERLTASTSRIRASGTPQTHLYARRSAPAGGVVLQVVRDDVGERSNEYR